MVQTGITCRHRKISVASEKQPAGTLQAVVVLKTWYQRHGQLNAGQSLSHCCCRLIVGAAQVWSGRAAADGLIIAP